MKIRAIRVGSAVKYGALFAAIYALLTGIPSAIAIIAIQRLVIILLAPVIKLFHGSVADALSTATSLTLLLLLCYVLATMLFVIIFTALATLAYNLVARFTGGLALELREVGPSREVIHEEAAGAVTKEFSVATEEPVSEKKAFT